MKPTVRIATTKTPDGGELVLYEHDGDYSIRISGRELMNSRQHESEMELARLGCSHLVACKAPRVLVGGLGMGYTLRQVLDLIGSDGEVLVCELLSAVIDWNREFFGELNGTPLNDKRIELKIGDVVELLQNSENRFDVILLDVDNGPDAMTDSGNHHLYSDRGIRSCRRALRKHGCFAIWSAQPSKPFEQRLVGCGFHVRRYRASTYRGSKSRSCFVWVASEKEAILPLGGGEPKTRSRTRTTRRHSV